MADRYRLNTGPGRLLIGVYLLFALAASARAAVQIAERFSEAPLAYLLSAFAGVVYIVAAGSLIAGNRAGARTALACILVELVGVLVVGTFTVLDPQAFPDDTVWSGYGRGYGFVPLVLPLLGLWWLWRNRRTAGSAS